MLYKTIKKNVLKFYSIDGKADEKRISTLIYSIYGLIKEGSCHLDTLGSFFDKETDIASRSKRVKRFLKSKYTDCNLLFFPF